MGLCPLRIESKPMAFTFIIFCVSIYSIWVCITNQGRKREGTSGIAVTDRRGEEGSTNVGN